MGEKDLLMKLSKIENSINEMRIDISYLKNAVNDIISLLNSNSTTFKDTFLQKDIMIYESLNEIKVLLNEILNILYKQKIS